MAYYRLPSYIACLFLLGKPSSLIEENNPDWAPSQNLGHQYSEVSQNSKGRHDRLQDRQRKQSISQLEESVSDNTTEIGGNVSMCSQTDLSMNQYEELLIENESLRKELGKYKLDIDSFIDNDKKTLHFTGLPNWQLLFSLYEYVKEDLGRASSVLTPFQKLLLTIMRMKLSATGSDLAYRFGDINESTISRNFNHVLDVLYNCLKPLIKWPDREDLQKTMPMDFRKHAPNCVAIIDCFEIFLECPSNPLAKAQTYSSYKHHNTVKYLIGITPQGTVSFISDGWGGRVSDKHLTEESGFLEYLLPGDLILADRGFDIRESVGLYCAMVKLPAFTKGKKQLSGIEVEQTRRIANLRIHVERVIGNIRKKYSMLSSTMPIDFARVRSADLTTIDKIVTVCSALINMCDSVVPFE